MANRPPILQKTSLAGSNNWSRRFPFAWGKSNYHAHTIKNQQAYEKTSKEKEIKTFDSRDHVVVWMSLD